jgi:hypothetical protein
LLELPSPLKLTHMLDAPAEAPAKHEGHTPALGPFGAGSQLAYSVVGGALTTRAVMVNVIA